MKKIAAYVFMGGLALFSGAAQAESPATGCALKSYGSCCVVKIGKGSDAKIETAIDSGGMVDFVLIKDADPAECRFLFDGEAKLPMRVYPDAAGFGFAGTWVGGNFSLRYTSDGANAGACRLNVYYMNIESPKMMSFPDKCVNGRFDNLLPPRKK